MRDDSTLRKRIYTCGAVGWGVASVFLFGPSVLLAACLGWGELWAVTLFALGASLGSALLLGGPLAVLLIEPRRVRESLLSRGALYGAAAGLLVGIAWVNVLEKLGLAIVLVVTPWGSICPPNVVVTTEWGALCGLCAIAAVWTAAPAAWP